MTIEAYASYWLAAAESRFATRDDWDPWAVKMMETMEHPPRWIIDLCLAASVDDLWRVLSPQIDEERKSLAPIKIHEAVLGYLWLRYKRGDYDLVTCLTKAGRHSDAYDTEVECEAFYSLLNALEAGEPVEEAAMVVFQPLYELACQQWKALCAAINWA